MEELFYDDLKKIDDNRPADSYQFGVIYFVCGECRKTFKAPEYHRDATSEAKAYDFLKGARCGICLGMEMPKLVGEHEKNV